LIQKTEAKLHEPAHRVGRYVTINESAYQDIDNAITPDLIPILLAFFIDRLKVQLKDQGIRHDVINAVVANGDDDLVRIVARAKALQDFLTTDDGKNLLIAYKRAANILTIEEGKDKTIYAAADIIPAALKEAEESNLAIMLLDAQVKNIKTWMVNEQFSEAMKHLSALRTPVDLFFDKIMVNCDDKDLRANRLRLLANIRDSMDNIANFALIEG
jgi:glycyl-tRNA synthetase beta chain